MYVHAALTRALPSARARAHDRSRSRYAIIIIAANNGPVIGALHAFLVLLFGSFASFGQVTPFASAFSLSFSPPPPALMQLQSSSRVCTRLQQQSAISNSRGLQEGIKRRGEERVRGGGRGSGREEGGDGAGKKGKQKVAEMNGEQFTRTTRSSVRDVSRPSTLPLTIFPPALSLPTGPTDEKYYFV